ncbi:MAG TPA: hypothetical protein VLF69_01140 [Candidatus Saccharimonadales bacterium]|nr:hypothetical protein [Candidatus Saccharimonadales bacterium]
MDSPADDGDPQATGLALNEYEDAERQELVDESSPIDGEATEASIKENTISDIQKDAAWLELQLQEYREIISHRKNWSDGLLLLVGFIIICDFIIVVASGTGLLQFSNAWAIPAFITSNLAEVFGLSFIVVQYLFPNSKGSRKDKDS